MSKEKEPLQLQELLSFDDTSITWQGIKIIRDFRHIIYHTAVE